MSIQEVATDYQTLFGRAPDIAGLNYWASQGLSGQTLADAMLANAGGPDRVAHANIVASMTPPAVTLAQVFPAAVTTPAQDAITIAAAVKSAVMDSMAATGITAVAPVNGQATVSAAVAPAAASGSHTNMIAYAVIAYILLKKFIF